MVIARRIVGRQQILGERLTTIVSLRPREVFPALLFAALLISGGCGQTAKPVVAPSNGQVQTYFGGPFLVQGSPVTQPAATAFDHLARQIAVSGTIISNSTHSSVQVPVNLINGTFTSADTGFLAITENYATTSSGVPSAQNPSLTGAWAVEIPGAGALANLLSVYTQSTPQVISAAPTAMAENTACPNSNTPPQFLYVSVPYASQIADLVDYGIVAISSQGSTVTFAAQPFLVGAKPQATSTVSGACSQTVFGELTAYPQNTFGTSGPLPELISIGSGGLLVSNFDPGLGGVGAFGGGTGVLGVAQPTSPTSLASVVAAQYNGFIFSPSNPLRQSNGYDITVLASAFGNHTGTSQTCSALQASLAANNGQGENVPVLPSPNTIYGGEFLIASPSGNVNDPTGANGSENCDVAIDLGTEDPSSNGLFPRATVFIGSNFPPFSVSNPWMCATGGVCAVSFPAAAVVGQVQGAYVIFVSASGTSTPQAQLPDGSGFLLPQPVGIYLFQKM